MKNHEVQYQQIGEEAVGRRIDNYLISFLKGVPKSWVYRVIRKGEVRINSRRASPLQRLSHGDKVRIPPVYAKAKKRLPVLHARTKRQLEDAVIYENKDIVVLNKPSGMSVHAGNYCNLGLSELVQNWKQEKLSLAHRLDRETSGCLIFAKTRAALCDIHQSFREGKVKKTYITLLLAQWNSQLSDVNLPLTVKHKRLGAQVYVDIEKGKQSRTYFELAETFQDYILVNAYPVSGRMHQIRVHASYYGNPIAGDKRYGNFLLNRKLEKIGLKRLFLHAYALQFEHQGEMLRVQAPMPKSLSDVMLTLRETTDA